VYIVPFQQSERVNGLGFYQPLHNVDVGYTYTVNPGLIVRLSGGVIRGPQFAYTAGGGVEKRLQGVWLTGGFQRYLSFFGPLSPIGAAPRTAVPFAQGLLPGSVYQVASLGVKGKLTKRLSVKVSGMNVRNEAGIQYGNIRSWVARCRAEYKLTGPLVAFTQLDFFNQNLNDFSPLPLSRRRYFGGVQIVLSHPHEVVNVPSQPLDDSTDSDPSRSDVPENGQRDN
jgi:hypothetical protein